MGEVKFGELKGVDRNGNKYFENTEYPFGQHRWVEYKVRPYLCSHVRVCGGGYTSIVLTIPQPVVYLN